ncbi:DNA polymerase I, partial [Candidatus Aerophobetes bacterium]|nr:DNA polymerase I [Candidatus Aerophobetes bacterium]
MEKEKLILIDGNALLYRSFYALPPLTNSEGIPTGGVYGFTRILLKLLREENPTYLACAFDKGKKTFRHKKYKEYKATRPKTPQELAIQIPLIKEILKGFNIPIFEEDEYEADDILVTLAKEAKQMGLNVKIFTGDKDILQIVSPSIYIVRFKKGISQTQLFDEQQVKKEYGVFPSQIADYLSLTGDVSDNIPGVPGIGPVTAKNLIQKFGNLENILANLEKISPKVREILKKYSEQARLSKRLATVLTCVPVKVDLNKFKLSPPQKDLLFPLFKKLEFKELIKQFEPSTSLSSSFKDISSLEQLGNLINKLSQKTFVIEVGEKEIVFSPVQTEDVFKIVLNRKSLNKLHPILENSEIKKIGHNLKLSILKLRKMGYNLKGLDFDTQIAAYLLN